MKEFHLGLNFILVFAFSRYLERVFSEIVDLKNHNRRRVQFFFRFHFEICDLGP